MNVDALVVRVHSLDEAVAFWTGIGGMVEVDRRRGWIEVEHPATHQRLRLLTDYDFEQAISIQTDDLDHAIAEMGRLLGAHVVSRGAGPEIKCAQLEDAAGVRYGICQPVPAGRESSSACGC